MLAGAANSPLGSAADAGTPPGDSSAAKFDDEWQTYVDSGLYPPRPHLFLDDLFIESMEGVRRVVHEPKKVGDQAVLRVEKPWEGISIKFRNSVIYVVMPANPITVGDEVFLFYYGKNRGKVWGEPTTDGKGITSAALGLAKLPRDRWVSIAAEGAGGTLLSKHIFFSNNELHVNVDARGGSVRAELQDGDGKPVAGYTLDECDPISIDSFDHVVTWRGGKSDFTGEIGTAQHYPPKTSRAMRIKFVLENAHLYSFSC